jgi:hypothetical protein
MGLLVHLGVGKAGFTGVLGGEVGSRGEVVQGFFERNVEVDGARCTARAAFEGAAHRAAHARRQFGQVHERFVKHVVVHGVCRVHARLGNRLAVPSSDRVGGPVGRDAQEWNAGVKRLGQGRAVVECRSAGSANNWNGSPRRQGQAEGVVRRRPFVKAHMHLNARLVMKSEHKRRISRTGACHRVPNALFGQNSRQNGRRRVRAAHLHVAKVRGG